MRTQKNWVSDWVETKEEKNSKYSNFTEIKKSI